MSRRSIKTLFIIYALLVNAKAGSANILSDVQMTALLKDPTLKVSATSMTVIGSGPSVTILTEEDSKTADQDLKIDAVFLSKALIEAAPNQIESVKILFSQADKRGRFISINRKEIQDFGKGKLTPQALLGSLRLIDVEPDRLPNVVSGPRLESRLLLWRRIEKLRAQGTGVAPFEQIFSEIEAAAKAGESTKVSDKVDFLEGKLAEQEEQVSQAKKTAHGLGVPAPSSSLLSSVSTQQVSAASSAATISKRAEAFEAARSIYAAHGQEWIEEIERKNSTSGEKLRYLKSRIDDRLRLKENLAAAELIQMMGVIVQRELGGPNPFPTLVGVENTAERNLNKSWIQRKEANLTPGLNEHGSNGGLMGGGPPGERGPVGGGPGHGPTGGGPANEHGPNGGPPEDRGPNGGGPFNR